MKEIKTLQDLLSYIASCPHEDRMRPLLVASPDFMHIDGVVELQLGICIGKASEFGFFGARSPIDNKYHDDDIVLYVNENPFDYDGAISYRYVFDELNNMYSDSSGFTAASERLQRNRNSTRTTIRTLAAKCSRCPTREIKRFEGVK